jgi:hypothetical protein
MNNFYAHLSEIAKRQYAGLEAMRSGYNGVIGTTWNPQTYCKERKKELENEKIPRAGFIRSKGGGRKKAIRVNDHDFNSVKVISLRLNLILRNRFKPLTRRDVIILYL